MNALDCVGYARLQRNRSRVLAGAPIPSRAKDGTVGRRTERHAIDNDNRIDLLTDCPTCGRSLVDDFADVTVDHDRYEIHAADTIVRLTQTEFSLFWMLYRKRGLTVPKEPLFERLVQLRGKRGKLEPRTVDTRMSILRKKVAPLRMRIETRWGKGVALLRGP